MGLKLTNPPAGGDNDRRRFDLLVLQALRELDSRSASGTSGSSDATRALTLISALTQRVAALEQTGTAAGEPITITAAESITQYSVVTSDGDLADIDTLAHAGKVAGLALKDAAAGGTLTLATTGSTVEDDSWEWTPGQLFWVGALGALATVPGAGEFEQPIGVAISATTILVLLGEPVILDAADDPFVSLSASGLFTTTKAGFSDYMLSWRDAVDEAAAVAALGLEDAVLGPGTAVTNGAPAIFDGTSGVLVKAGTLTDLLDYPSGAAQGSILYRGASGWVYLGPGTAGDVLTTQGAGANPLWASSGGGVGVSTDHCVVYRSAALSVSATTQKVAMDTVSVDDNSIWDSTNKRVVPKKAGYYLVEMRIRCTAAGGMVGYVYRNGSIYMAVGADFGAAGFAVGGMAMVYCDGSADYIEIGIYSSNSRSVDNSLQQTHMIIVGPL